MILFLVHFHQLLNKSVQREKNLYLPGWQLRKYGSCTHLIYKRSFHPFVKCQDKFLVELHCFSTTKNIHFKYKKQTIIRIRYLRDFYYNNNLIEIQVSYYKVLYTGKLVQIIKIIQLKQLAFQVLKLSKYTILKIH